MGVLTHPPPSRRKWVVHSRSEIFFLHIENFYILIFHGGSEKNIFGGWKFFRRPKIGDRTSKSVKMYGVLKRPCGFYRTRWTPREKNLCFLDYFSMLIPKIEILTSENVRLAGWSRVKIDKKVSNPIHKKHMFLNINIYFSLQVRNIRGRL